MSDNPTSLSVAIWEIVQRFVRESDQHKEALCAAWIAETGLSPSESQLNIQMLSEDGRQRIWITKRDDDLPQDMSAAWEARALAAEARLAELSPKIDAVCSAGLEWINSTVTQMRIAPAIHDAIVALSAAHAEE